MSVDALHALAVERTTAGCPTAGQANGDRAGDVRAPEVSGGLINDLVETAGTEVSKLHFNNRAGPFKGGTNGHADHGIFADR